MLSVEFYIMAKKYLREYLGLIAIATLLSCSNQTSDSDNRAEPKNVSENEAAAYERTVQQTKEQQQERQQTMSSELSSADTKKTKNDKPRVTSSTSGDSVPLSQLSGNAQQHQYDELYVVPNRFPEADEEKQNTNQQDKKTKPPVEPPPSNDDN